jgi:hypothetical protein
MEMAQSTSINKSSSEQESQHLLSDKWVLWAHLPHDTDWTLKSYINIVEFDTVEKVIAVINTIPPTMIKNCMLFVMKKGINPTWEDPKNCKGGCFSFKIMNKQVCQVWNDLLKVVTGNTISIDKTFVRNVNGITISPKKAFCIMKIWMSGTDKQNPKVIVPINGLNSHGCLFKKHNPEY